MNNEIDAIPVDDEEIDAIPVDDGIDALPVTPKAHEVKVQRPPVSLSEAFFTRAGKAASLGLTEPVSAAITAGILDRIPGNDHPTFAQKYEFARKSQAERQERIGKERPLAATAGTVTGGGLLMASPMGAGSMATLGGLTGAAEGKGVEGRLLGAATGVALPAVFSKLPNVVKSTLPVGAGAYDLATAKPGADTIEALANLALMGATSGTQAVRGSNRFLKGRAQKAGDQVFFEQADKLANMKREGLGKTEGDLLSAQAREHQYLGEVQNRVANEPGMSEFAKKNNLGPYPQTISPQAIPMAKKAIDSFYSNSPRKLVDEAQEVQNRLLSAQQADLAERIKWQDPEAVAASLSRALPAPHGPVEAKMARGAEAMKAKELEAARSRVPEEVARNATGRALWGSIAGVPAWMLGQRVVPMTAGAAAAAGILGAGQKVRQLLSINPETRAFNDPAAANVIYDAIPSVVRKFPSMAKYASLATDAGVRARPAFLMLALQRDPDFARALEEEVTGQPSEP